MGSGAHLMDDLPKEIQSEAGDLLADLRALGWEIHYARYDDRVFGNWFVEMLRGGDSIQLVKDRSQFSLDGPPIDILRDANLWRVFEDFSEFRQEVMNWAAK